MQFWEDFFSTDKLKYPICGSILLCSIMLLLSYIIGLSTNEYITYLYLIIGFLLGNHIKINKLREIRSIEKIKLLEKNKPKK